MDPFLLIMLLALIAMMWFTTSRQRKAQRERDEFRNSLAPGDRVMTTSGLHANVVSLDEASGTAVLDAGQGPMTWSRDAISKRVEVAAPIEEVAAPLDESTQLFTESSGEYLPPSDPPLGETQ